MTMLSSAGTNTNFCALPTGTERTRPSTSRDGANASGPILSGAELMTAAARYTLPLGVPTFSESTSTSVNTNSELSVILSRYAGTPLTSPASAIEPLKLAVASSASVTSTKIGTDHTVIVAAPPMKLPK